MEYQMQYSRRGVAGAALFIGSVFLTGANLALLFSDLATGRSQSGLAAEPLLYVGLSTACAIGLVLMLTGRRIIATKP